MADLAQFNATLDRLMLLMERMATTQAAPPPINVHLNLGELLAAKKKQPADGDAPPPDGVPDPGRRQPYPYTS